MSAGTLGSTDHPLEPGLNIRQLFPIFGVSSSRPLAYLDSAASALKPACVVDRISRYLAFEHANIHRGAYALSANATVNYEAARQRVATFIGAKDANSIVFTRGATSALNLVAHGVEGEFSPGDVILLSLLERHSNIVPWQMLASRKKLRVEFVDINAKGELDLDDFKRKLNTLKPKLVAVTALSNSLGTLPNLSVIIGEARKQKAAVLVDAAQAIAHFPIDVSQLDADFLVFSGHKLYGPTGIGVLYAKGDWLMRMQPFEGGGDMISRVTIEGSAWADPPRKFEAGTPPIAEAIALGTAIEFVEAVGLQAINRHDRQLLDLAFDRLSAEAGVDLYGPLNSEKQHSILAFNLKGIHPHDLATIADSVNVQIRGGHHCAMPTHKRLGLSSSARLSFGVYSAPQDLDALIEAIRKAQRVLG